MEWGARQQAEPDMHKMYILIILGSAGDRTASIEGELQCRGSVNYGGFDQRLGTNRTHGFPLVFGRFRFLIRHTPHENEWISTNQSVHNK